MPVLRQPAAQARAEDRPRGPVAERGAGARRPRRCRGCGAARSPGSAPSRGRTRRSLLVAAGLVGCLLWRTALVSCPGRRGRRQARIALVAAAHRGVHVQQHRLRVRRARRDRPVSAGCSSAATVRCRCIALFLVGGVGGIAAAAAVYAFPVVAGRQRRRARDARRLGDPGPARAARGRGDRGRPARHAVIAVVVALMPLAVREASWIADGVGVLVGLVRRAAARPRHRAW